MLLLAAAGLVRLLIDGDNVRGKSGFQLSKSQLLQAVVANHRDDPCVLYYDHGPEKEAFYIHDSLSVVFSGPHETADDSMVRDVPYFEDRLVLVTSDAGLMQRCRRKRRKYLDVKQSSAFLDAFEAWNDADSFSDGQKDAPSPFILDVAQRLSAGERLVDELKFAGERENVEAAIAACGGGLAGKEETWERVLTAAELFSHLRNACDNDPPSDSFLRFRDHVRRPSKPSSATFAKRWRRGRRETLTMAAKRWRLARDDESSEGIKYDATATWPSGWPEDQKEGELRVAAMRRREGTAPTVIDVTGDNSDQLTILVTSDTHGFGGLERLEGIDLAIHAGDFALESRDRNANARAQRHLEEWLAFYPAALVVRGNHDPRKLNATHYATQARLFDVVKNENRTVRVLAAPHGSYRDVGSLAASSDQPIDLVVSHSPPAGQLDLTYASKRAGSKALRYGLESISPPKLWICGHIHESAGAAMFGDTLLLNAAAANSGVATSLVRKHAVVRLSVAQADNPKRNIVDTPLTPAVVRKSVDDDDGHRSKDGPLLAIDLGIRRVGAAVVDKDKIVAYAAGRDPAECVRAMNLEEIPTVVVAEGPAHLRDLALRQLQAENLVRASAADLYAANHWRRDLLIPKESKSHTTAKQAAKLIADQFLARSKKDFQSPPSLSSTKLTVDAAEAICLGVWTAAHRQGWNPLNYDHERSSNIVQRYTNGIVVKVREQRAAR